MDNNSEKIINELKKEHNGEIILITDVKVANDQSEPNITDDVPPKNGGHGITADHPTSYLETMMHIFKGNVGPGLFAMGDAFKNGGIIVAPILTLFLGIVSVHCQHILIKYSRKMKEFTNNSEQPPDFAETVELCFANGPPILRKYSKIIKAIVNIFVCVTQLGFCCVYFVFISSNLKQLFDYYGFVFDSHIHMAFIFIPILLPSLITNLKYLAPCSTVANFCMITGIGITLYFTCQDLPSPSERKYFSSVEQLPLFFGTAIFAFEGISLVLPLQNAMKKPHHFSHNFGVLNIGMTIVTTILIVVGFCGYLKYGEQVEGSLTLNLPDGSMLAQSVKVVISIGVLLGYALQFFIAIEIMWPSVYKKYPAIKQHPFIGQLLFRFVWVFITFAIAEAVPKLSVFISLIGALCSTALALVFPPVVQLVAAWGTSQGPSKFVLIKNMGILIIALLGFLTGTYESLAAILRAFKT